MKPNIEQLSKEYANEYYNNDSEDERSKTECDLWCERHNDFIAGAKAMEEYCLQKEQALNAKIIELQEKYDENGYGCSSLVKLQRLEQCIDAAFQNYANLLKEQREIWDAAKEGKIEKVPVFIDQYGSINIEEVFVPKYKTLEDYLNSKTNP